MRAAGSRCIFIIITTGCPLILVRSANLSYYSGSGHSVVQLSVKKMRGLFWLLFLSFKTNYISFKAKFHAKVMVGRGTGWHAGHSHHPPLRGQGTAL